MGKKILCLMLCLLFVLSALPVQAAKTEEELLCETIEEEYLMAIADSGRESLNGYCGLLASYQLYYRGINSWLLTANGNDHYDIYIEDTLTTGGYGHRDYSAVNFSMEEALNFACRSGAQDVYNALVCFQYTNTEAGRKYGHVVYIYAILDGMIYFTESFNLDDYHPAGTATTMTVSEFVNYYKSWTTFEGLVVFGKKDYTDNCTAYSTNLFVEVAEEAELTSEPCALHSTEAACMQLRHVMPGERLYATGLYKNPVGAYYYRIQDGTQIGYIPAQQVNILRVNFEDVTIAEATVPETIAVGEDFAINGDVSALYSDLENVRIEICDETGQMLQGYSQTMLGTACNLDEGGFNSLLNFGALKEGYYTYSVFADSVNHYLMDDGSVFNYKDNRCLLTKEFCVGDLPVREQVQETVAPRVIRDGWSYVDGNWYYYEAGSPRTGWFYHNGVDYYLQEDGAVTTGWAEVNGKLRYFTATGAMRTGWVITKEGPVLLLSNGALAQGWISIDGVRCWFNENGTLGQGWITDGDKQYYLDENGTFVTGWQTLEEGKFCFHEEGHLIAQQIEEDGKFQVIPMTNFPLIKE